MQLRDNGLGFSPITIVLHWVAAAAVVTIIILQLYISNAGDTMWIAELKRVRNTLGLLLFFVSCYRLWARLSTFHPLPVGSPNPLEVIISRSVAVSLTLACVLLPVAAWLSMSADAEAVELLGGSCLPALLDKDEGARKVFDTLFLIGAAPFIAGLALHLFGVCKNHFVLKNDTLLRMLGKEVEL